MQSSVTSPSQPNPKNPPLDFGSPATTIEPPGSDGTSDSGSAEQALLSKDDPTNELTHLLGGVSLAPTNTPSNIDRVKVSHETLMAKYDLHPTYPAAAPGVLVEPTSSKGIPKVLLVFLGPSRDTCASQPKAQDWNPFLTIDGGYTRSLLILNNKLMDETGFSLHDFYLTDAFPLLYWNGNKSPTAAQYEAHFKYGVDHVRHVIEVLKPEFVLSFGNQAAWVVEKVFNKNLSTLRSNFGTNGNYTHGIGGAAYKYQEQRISVYYCHHPNSRSKSKFDLVIEALKEISKATRQSY